MTITRRTVLSCSLVAGAIAPSPCSVEAPR